jgi:ribonuclease HI/transposase InsO family protein
MKLNPTKCVFGVPAGKLLGFIVSERGIEANPDKIKAIMNLKKPECVNDVQKLTGCVTALSRFIARMGEKALPLYKLLKKSDKFVWGPEADDADFEDLKKTLSSAPVLAAPTSKEPMLLYVSANSRAVSAVVVVERKEEGKEYPVQRPVYYVSEALTESKQRYPQWQKLVFGVFMASRKMPHYFQEHPITVVSAAPLAEIIRNREATGRVAKWAIEMGPYHINYEPRTAIKSQALVDFVNDWTEFSPLPSAPGVKHWTMHFDGSKMFEGSGAGVVLTSPRGDKLSYVLQIHFDDCTNNIAEYEALLHGLRVAKEMNIKRIMCYGDSDLVAQQVSGTWDRKDAKMAAYRREVDKVAGFFTGYQVEHIDRRKNEAADNLSRLGSKREPVPPNVFLAELHHPSVKLPTEEELANPDEPDSQLVAALHQTPSWTEPYMAYLLREELPEDEVLARQIVRRAKGYSIIEGELYKRSTAGVFLRCVSPEEGRKILQEIHSGDCGHHASTRSMVAKAFRHGFFWLTALADAEHIARVCDGCQRYARQIHVPAQDLRTIPITWPFAVWGMDMVGPFQTSPAKKTHLLVAVDKFTKWIEVMPVNSCSAATAVKFLKRIIYRFGYPHSIITDNGTNFSLGEMQIYCRENGIRLDLASVSHPQSNGQVERANQELLRGIKPRLRVPLERAAGCWEEELPSVVWSINTTPNRSTEFTPFFMVYGAEAVLPSDILHDSPRVANYVEAGNEQARQNSVDMLEEARELALERSAVYQQDLRRYHSRRVRSRSFQEGDLVLRLAQNKTGFHKLTPPWEGPFVISRNLHNGSYYLVDSREQATTTGPNTDHTRHPLTENDRPWNIAELRPYYT